MNKKALLPHRLFIIMSEDDKDYLAERALQANYNEGEVIIDAGTHPMDRLFLIIEGSVT